MHRLQIGIATVFAGAMLSVVAVQAQNGELGAPGTADASKITAGTYVADPGHTLVQWNVNHLGFSDYYGLFGDVTGTLTLDPANLEASVVDVAIPVAKVTTASAGLTSHMLRDGKDGGAPDFFGSNPADATFKSTAVRKTSETEADIDGVLTLSGVSKPVTLKARFTGAGVHPYNKKESVGFTATARIKRSDFGMKYGIPGVTDTVDLQITAAFEK